MSAPEQAAAPAPEPRIVGVGDNGKPRVRMPAGWQWNNLYRNLDLPGQAGMMFPTTSAKSETRDRDRAVRAARDVDRNHETIRGALDRKATTVVGGSLRVNPMPNWRRLGLTLEQGMGLGQQLADVFAEWATDDRCLCDTEGHYQFGGLMWQGFRTLAGPDAEIAGIIHYEESRREEYNTEWATHVQLVDPDRIGTPPDRIDNDGTIYRGRELDRHGRMTALHIRREHPADSSTDPRAGEYARVERETYWGRPTAFHWFFKRRAGLQRALTSMVASLRHIKMLDRFDDATLQNAIVNGILATSLTTEMTPEQAAAHLAPAYEDDDGDPYSSFDITLKHLGEMELKVGNQRTPILPPNTKLNMQRVADAIPGAEDFRNGFLRAFASALGVSFEQLSLDFSRSNYSSIRASLLEAWRTVMFERNMFTAHVAKLIYSAVIEEAFAIGKVTLPAGAPEFYDARAAYTACTWTGPGMGWVDPKKEAEAAGERKAGLITTLEQEAAAQGGNWRDNIDQQAIERAHAASMGVPYDRAPAAAGTAADDETDDEQDQDAQDERETQEAAA